MSDLLQTLATPALLLDRDKVATNVARLRSHVEALGSRLRLHVKTAKSVDVVRFALGPQVGPITVSTLKEAEVFADAGFRDILYAVGFAPDKLERALALVRRGVSLGIVLDSLAAARALAEKMRGARDPLAVSIEIDTDGHRAGLQPDDPRLIEVAGALAGSRAELTGVMTHAGESYNCRSIEAIVAMAEREREGAVRAANRLRAAGFPISIVSVGSTPTATYGRDLTGVTEVRAGVFVFFDLVMAGIGVCTPDDIALSVLATVIGHQHDRGWIITDAGWMALSRDRGTSKQGLDQGYGVVCDLDGRAMPGLIVSEASQEHGIISMRPGESRAAPQLPIGTRVRILPNHACATAAQFDRYQVHAGPGGISAVWPRFAGW